MRKLKIHRVYKHFKGDLYFVEGIATHSETKEKYPMVKQKYRFELQETESVKDEFERKLKDE